MRSDSMQPTRSRGPLRLVEARPAVPRRKPSAEGYYARIEEYAHRIRGTEDVSGIIGLLEEALRETRALHTAHEVAEARLQLVTAEDRIERLKSELELVNQLVREDQLTGALNRRGLEHALAREAVRADRKASALCLALIDLDDFKRLNDGYGHQAGDCVLVHLVALIRDTIRGNDLIGRYGGEEFLLVLPDSGVEESSAVMNRLRDRLHERPLLWDSDRLRVSFSAGIAERHKGEDQDSVIARADKALYEAKRLGKNRVMVAP